MPDVAQADRARTEGLRAGTVGAGTVGADKVGADKVRGDRMRAGWANAVTNPILILGAPRSGTTWLAKIIDSHPDVLYRHEPDETLPSPAVVTPESLPALLRSWIADRTPRSVAKRPFFAKSWQPAPGRWLRTAWAGAAGLSSRLPVPFSVLGHLPIPDLAIHPPPRVALKSVRWTQGAPVLARAMPDSRILFILRHPCGQVASVMRGNRQNRFDLRTEGTDMPFDEERAIRHAAAFGVDEPSFQALPDAGKYAWSWRAFNEPADAALAGLPNVLIVPYEALCAAPMAESRRVMAFVDLAWNRQTEDFIARSTTHDGDAGYYAIFRNAVAAAGRWRTTMPEADQRAVRHVVMASPLARYWPDLAAASPAAG
ncbi:sulfotransferase family protein [Rhodopila sp.]|uniref:sulfotransferase family protein n=1 Tax=Rhodopila sp. TaxID=2480087 RepID=UPI002B9D4A96|nr:sulfotransferase [Rhodopila sp.]HVZ10250.1 sulfotransferase [Rhodopila sp.]